MKKYKLTWEMVGAFHLSKFSNADPMYFKNTTQIIPNSEIPDQYWHTVTKEFDERELKERMDQFKRLKEWSDADKEFVRNVHLYEMFGEPSWEEIDG